MGPKPKPVIERFMPKVEKTESCWHWRGARKKGGYGHLLVGGRMVGAHRVSLMLFRGIPLETQLEAMHSCDVPGCVNPDHLSYGTHKQNMADASMKGLIRCVNDWSGHRNPKAKLTSADLESIRRMLSAGATVADVALAVKVTKVRIYQLRKKLAA